MLKIIYGYNLHIDVYNQSSSMAKFVRAPV